ncbi:hypothetical protein DP130_07165 [Clostridium tetani]|uniref:ABC transporter permease n=1 Tax=Clostridium tetani TaxID=1513 RepID=A0A4Q0VBS6_CLOTA|nr:ABC transporter permease [Clostridium tetani]RXI48504.1 hypothetical protein DP130_07165 [Clostridium tetani]
MWRKFFRKIRNMSFIIICITSIILFTSLSSSNIKSVKDNIKEANNLKTDNHIKFYFNKEANDRDIRKVIDGLKDEENIIITHLYGLSFNFDVDIKTEGIYFNGIFDNGYKLMSGRFFTKEDFKGNEKIVVIGKDLVKYCNTIDGEKYIASGKNKYKVIGVIGKKDKPTRYDYSIVYNLNCELDENKKISQLMWSIDSKNKQEHDLINIINEINDEYNVSIINMEHKQEQFNPLFQALKNSNFLIANFIFIIICICLTLINSLVFWIKKIQKEIGIRKSFGASNRNILFDILLRYLFASFISIIIGLIIQKLLLLLNIISIEYYGLSYVNLIISTIIVLVLGIFSIKVVIYKINKLKLSELLKEN